MENVKLELNETGDNTESPLNEYQKEFLEIQKELNETAIEKMRRANDEWKREFEILNDKWHENFIDDRR